MKNSTYSIIISSLKNSTYNIIISSLVLFQDLNYVYLSFWTCDPGNRSKYNGNFLWK